MKPDKLNKFDPSMVVRIDDFLPRNERDSLYEAACAHQNLFGGPAGLKLADGTLRTTPEMYGKDESAAPLREAVDLLSGRIHDQLPSLFAELHIDPFPLAEIPLDVVNGLEGHLSAPHNDSVLGRFELSVLYYFFREPKAFGGGDLEFYDTDESSSTGHGEEPVYQIEPEDNLFLAFPSRVFHGATAVQCASKDFADGRFLAVSFLGRQ